jgi:hypothetical protein
MYNAEVECENFEDNLYQGNGPVPPERKPQHVPKLSTLLNTSVGPSEPRRHWTIEDGMLVEELNYVLKEIFSDCDVKQRGMLRHNELKEFINIVN